MFIMQKIKKSIAYGATVFLSLCLAACGGKTDAPVPTTQTQPVEETPSEKELALEQAMAKYENTEETGEETAMLDTPVSVLEDELTMLYGELDAIEAVYPYGDIINVTNSYERYQTMGKWESDADYGMVSNLPLNPDALLELVQENNREYLSRGVLDNGHVFVELDEEYLLWACEIICDTINEELTSWNFNEQLAAIDYNLSTLTIFKNEMGFNNASYTNEGVMTFQPAFIESMITITDNPLADKMTVTHEVEHLLQKLSNSGYEALGVDRAYGFCYWWNDLPVNALYNSWFVEASAEKLAAYFYDTEPTTYSTMIGYLDSLTHIALLKGSQPEEVPRLSQQQGLDAVFTMFDCETEEEKLEFLHMLYAIEVIQQEPDDFWTAYTAATGLEKTEEENAEVKKSLKAAACLTMSRMFYENMIRLLTMEELTLREVFYLTAMWEFDLNMHLIYEDETRLDTNTVFFEGYTDMQRMFFRALSSELGISEEQVTELYIAYHCRAKVPKRSMLYGDEIWDGADIGSFGRETNDFWDDYYQNVSWEKTVPVCVAAEILMNR